MSSDRYISAGLCLFDTVEYVVTRAAPKRVGGWYQASVAARGALDALRYVGATPREIEIARRKVPHLFH